MSMYQPQIAELATQITAALVATGTVKSEKQVCDLYKAIYETIKECDNPKR